MALPEVIALPAAGERWPVRYERGERNVAREVHGVLVVATDSRRHDVALEAIDRWLRRRARLLLVPALLALAKQTELPVPENVRIGMQRSRWASCSSKGTVSLNARILFLPPDLMRHVLLHELCHQVHLNHSKAFYALLAKYEPRHPVTRVRMREAWRYVPDWAGGAPTSDDAD